MHVGGEPARDEADCNSCHSSERDLASSQLSNEPEVPDSVPEAEKALSSERSKPLLKEMPLRVCEDLTPVTRVSQAIN